ncbi:MAG: TonB family protein [Cyanobacteria bacterium P01_H01_bin.121]
MTITIYTRPEPIIVPALRNPPKRNNRLWLLLVLSLLVHVLGLVGWYWLATRRTPAAPPQAVNELDPIEFIAVDPETLVEPPPDVTRQAEQNSDDSAAVNPDLPVDARQQQASPTAARSPNPPTPQGAAAAPAAAPRATARSQATRQAQSEAEAQTEAEAQPQPETQPETQQATQSETQQPQQALGPRPPWESEPEAQQPDPQPQPEPQPQAQPESQPVVTPVDDLFEPQRDPEPTLQPIQAPVAARPTPSRPTPNRPTTSRSAPDLNAPPPAFQPQPQSGAKQPVAGRSRPSSSSAATGSPQSQVGSASGASTLGGSQLVAQGLDDFNTTLNSSRQGQGQSVAARQDVDMGPYIDNLRRQVERQWFPVQNNQPSRVIVRFDVTRNGGLRGLHISSTSGSGLVDNAAQTAIQQASPYFGPLPAGYEYNALAIEFSFTVTMEGNLTLF